MAKRFFTLLLAGALAACQGPPAASPPKSAPAPTMLRLAISDEPSTLDIQRTSQPAVSEVMGIACATLMFPTPEPDTPPQPWLAESWQVSGDNMAVTVTLRPDITFSNGAPLTATSVIRSFQRLQDPLSNVSPIHEDVAGVTLAALDDRTVIFKLPKANNDFIGLLANPYATIIDVAAADANAQAFGRAPICAGPYAVKEWRTAESITLERNPTYVWVPAYFENQGPAKIDQILLRFVSDDALRFRLLKENQIDAVSLSKPEEVADVRTEPQRFKIYEAPSSGISFIGFNYALTPTNQLQLRQALAYAIDKTSIVNTVMAGLAVPAIAPLSPNIYGYDDSLAADNYAYDPSISRTLLAAAGYADSDSDGIVEREGEPLKLRILTTTNDTYGKIAVVLQDELRQIGVDSVVQAVERSAISTITPTGEFDILLYEYSWGGPDALQIFLGAERIGATNRVAYSNPSVDEMVAQALSIPGVSPDKKQLLVEAQRQILRDAAWQPLLNRRYVVAVNTRVDNATFTKNGSLLWHNAEVK
jgi:peptide/nickel transport system substrate-binding protein